MCTRRPGWILNATLDPQRHPGSSTPPEIFNASTPPRILSNKLNYIIRIVRSLYDKPHSVWPPNVCTPHFKHVYSPGALSHRHHPLIEKLNKYCVSNSWNAFNVLHICTASTNHKFPSSFPCGKFFTIIIISLVVNFSYSELFYSIKEP